ncbi:retention module-containing protein [Oceanimonas sp. CHS3-5]|uniref:retention module-containing protein n=1 Tax=Oceanimonas sp. CHS3-5 TaxID=3068186 RepID=UPI00273E7CAF|nr:retention module-containing protein [Oceanimonas sp. CHS3-5]MDP5291613.1 retention module-containing protein [Oceanimonas sp. CHS3-5]
MDTTRIDNTVQVVSLKGQAFIIAKDGTVTLVSAGQILPPGTLLLTDENSGIVYDDAPENAMAAQPVSDEAAAEEAEAIQAAILAGLDPTKLFAAPAAGAPAAGPAAADGSGNAGFVVVDRTGDSLLAEAGFDTAFSPLSFTGGVDELPRVLEENSIPELDIDYDSPLTGPDPVPEFPDLADGGFAWVDEGALPEGSRFGSDNESATGALVIDTGNDALVLVEVQDAEGNWVDVTGGGTVTTQYGTLVVDENYNWTYTLNDAQSHENDSAVFDDDRLPESIPVRITDDDGEQAEGVINIEVLDDGPDAINDSASTPEDTPVEVDVISNDVQGADSASVTGVTLLTEGAGSVSFTEEGLVRFEPAPGFEGNAQIQYTLTDSDGDSDTAVLTVTVGDDSEPNLGITFADGRDWVDEAALDGKGSNEQSGNETTTGTFEINTFGDDLASLEVQVKDSNGNWVNVTEGGIIDGQYGALTVTQNPDGSYSWSYTLADNTDNHDDPLQTGAGDVVADDFDVRVTDSDASEQLGVLSIDVRDDGPGAIADTVSTPEDTAIEVDVISNDIQGADGATVTGVTLLTEGAGTVSLTEEGQLRFVPAAGFEGDAQIQYTLTDSDGDSDTAVLTVTVGEDSEPDLKITFDDDRNWVDEAALDGKGSNEQSGNETTSGTFGINTFGDQLASLEVQVKDSNGNWVNVTEGGIIDGQYGALTVTQNPDGSYSWSYTLADNTDNHDDPLQTGAGDVVADDFDVRVTDSDASEQLGVLSIDVRDDGPGAIADTVSTPEDTAIEVDVISNDIQGADGATVTGVTLLTEGAGTVSLTEEGQLRFVPAAGFEGDAQIQYTLTDSDGDSDTAVLTVTVGEDSEPDLKITFDDDRNWVDEAALDGKGSNEQSGNETTSGTFGINTFGDQLASLEVQVKDSNGNWVNVTNGGSIDGQYGELTVILNPDGSYSWSYTLTDNTENHTDPLQTGAADVVTDDFDVRVTDSDDSQQSGILSIDIWDDGPTIDAVQDGIMANVAGTLSGLIDLGFGADGQGSLVVSGEEPDGLVYTVTDGPDGSQVLTANLDDDSGDVYFILTVYPDGNYDFELVNPEPLLATTKELTGLTPGGPEPVVVLPINGITATFTELQPSPGEKGINSSENGMGVDDNRIDNGDVLRIAFSGSVSNTSFTLNKLSDKDVMAWVVLSAGIVVASGTWSPPAGAGEGGDTVFNLLEPIEGSFITYDEGYSAEDIKAGGFDEIQLGSDSGDYRLLDMTIYEEVFPEDGNLLFDIDIKDGDHDMDSASLSITIEADGTEASGFTLSGTSANEVLLGSDGDDILTGGEGDDILLGGLGDNILTGGEGIDTFRFTEADAGSVNAITDFEKGVDVVDLKELLSGEEGGNLTDYLTFSMEGNDTVLSVTPAGDGGDTQEIRFEDTNLMDLYGAASSEALIQAMVDDQTLQVDK